MEENQSCEAEIRLYAEDILRAREKAYGKRPLLTISPQETVLSALERMRREDISQLPVFENKTPLGAIYEDSVFHLLLEGKPLDKMVVREVMSPLFSIVDKQARIESIVRLITPEHPAVLVRIDQNQYEVITKYDLIHTATLLAEQKK